MPKGVEHIDWYAATKRHDDGVESLMPKGVEH